MRVKISLSNLSLKRRIFIAVALVSLLPLIVLFYHLSGYYISLWVNTILTIVILLGWWTIFEVFSAIIKIHTSSRITLKDIGEKIPSIPDEVQSLESVINLLSDKVKTGFEQLRDFTEKTENLNKEVSKTVLVLSTILQANDLFAKDAPVEEIIKFIISHLKHLLHADVCFCNLKEDISDNFKTVVCLGIEPFVMKKFFDSRKDDFRHIRERVILDRYNIVNKYSYWTEELGLKNMAIMPIISKGELVGVVGAGNRQEAYSFSKDELDILNLFSQNLTLIWEHARLSSKIEELEIVDYLTGLYNEKLVMQRLNEEIKRSAIYQRPCGFVTIKVENYDKYRENHGLIEAEKVLKKIARTFKTALRPIDIAGRIGPDMLGAILVESNKRQSQEIVDSLKKNLEEVYRDRVELVFAVAESPVNGNTAEELVQYAQAHSKK